MKHIFKFIPLLLLIAVFSCREAQSPHKYLSGITMGTVPYNIKYTDSLHRELQPQIDSLLESLLQSLSTFIPTSTISIVNKATKPVHVNDPHFIRVFERSMQIADITDGAFDPTVMPLVNAWGFGFRNMANVNEDTIDSILHFVDYRKVRLLNDTLYKDDHRLMLDFSAIAKGYIVDEAGRYLESKGIHNYMVEIGGDLRTKGVNREGNKWTIGIESPDEQLVITKANFFSYARMGDQSLATSGNYRQFYERDGKKYSHTIDPMSGFPVRHSLLSSSVFAEDCMTADAYATAFMVMGLKKSVELAEKIPEIQVYLIYENNEGELQSYVSEELKTQLTAEL